MKLTGCTATMLGLTLLAGCGGEESRGENGAISADSSHLTDNQGEASITLDSATIARIGLKTAALAEGVHRDEVESPAEVTADPGATSFVRAGVSGRLALPPGGHWPGFGDRLEGGAVLASVGDALPVTVPRSGTVTRVLAQPGELVQAGQELIELTSYEAPLVRVPAPAELRSAPATMVFTRAGGGPRMRGTLVGAATEADPLTHRAAWLYRVPDDGSTLRPGTAVTAYAAVGAVRRGVVIPAQAVIQWDALLWAYVEREPGRFVRVRLAGGESVPGGWLVEHDFAAGDRVVITGAEQLLSEEFRARIVVGEEVGE